MIHHSRRYSVRQCSSVPELVNLLSTMTWCGCNAFKYGDLIFANDSFSADGAQEYAVIRDSVQIESLTVSWMEPADLKSSIERMINRPESYEAFSTKIPLFDHPNGPCYHCA